MNTDEFNSKSAPENKKTTEFVPPIETDFNNRTTCIGCLKPVTPLDQKSLRNQLLELIEKHGFATVLDTFYIVFNSEYPDTDCNYELEKLVATLEEEGL